MTLEDSMQKHLKELDTSVGRVTWVVVARRRASSVMSPNRRSARFSSSSRKSGYEAIINVLTHMAEPAKGSQIGPLGNLFSGLWNFMGWVGD
jgi:hypothetical protein